MRFPKQKSTSNRARLIQSYAQISKRYLALKQKPWKDFLKYYEYLESSFSLPKEGVIIDLGAGNGRNLSLFKKEKRETVALDLSIDLLRGINGRELNCFNVINADITKLPFRASITSLALCIAVIHHLGSKNEVKKALKDISTILNDGGYLILSCWRRWKRNTLLTMIKDLVLFPLLKLKNPSWRHGDYNLPWYDKERKTIAKRYYHLFTRRELTSIIAKTQLEICDFSTTGGKNGRDNFFVLLRKVSQ